MFSKTKMNNFLQIAYSKARYLSLGLETREVYWADLLSAGSAFLNLKMADQVCWKTGDKKNSEKMGFSDHPNCQQKIIMNLSNFFKVYPRVHWKYKAKITIVNSPNQTMCTVTEPKLPSGAMPAFG